MATELDLVRKIWRATPALQLAHADFESFADAHRAGRDESFEQTRALQLYADGRDRSLEIARRRLEALRAPRLVCDTPIFDRHGSRAVLWLYGKIGCGFTLSGLVLDQLQQHSDAGVLWVRCCSAGGRFDGAHSIHAAIARFPGRTIGVVDRYAYSAASLILSACDRVLMRKSATWMTHPVSQTTTGNAEQLRRVADRLDDDDRTDVVLYAAKRRAGIDVIRELMKSERYLGAAEALELGVVDDVIEDLPLEWD